LSFYLESDLDSIFNAVIDGVTITDLEGNILQVNNALLKMYGFDKKEEMIGRSALEFIKKEEQNRATKNIRKTLDDGYLRSVEYTSIKKDGTEFPIELSVGLLKDSIGKPTGFIGITKDISRRVAAERKLNASFKKIRESEAQLNAIFQSSQIIIVFFDKNRRIQSFNAPAAEIARKILGKELVIGASWLDYIPEAFYAQSKNRFNHILKGNSSILDWQIRDMEGNEHWFALTYNPVKTQNGEIMGFSLMVLDISERKKYEKEQKRSREQLHQITQHLQSIREEERTHLAHEIHDELGQRLSLLKIDLDLLSKKIGDSDKTLLKEMHSFSQQVENIIRDVKYIARGLDSRVVNQLNLVQTMRWQAKEIEKRTNLHIKLKIDIDEQKVNKNIAVSIFRIFQEALTNIIRHAGATKVDVVLKTKHEKIIFIIKDNGQGIPSAKIVDPRSMGIAGIKERVFALAGEIKIISRWGRYTAFVIKIPLPSEKGEKL